jgi:ArsR family transcriptional regulator
MAIDMTTRTSSSIALVDSADLIHQNQVEALQPVLAQISEPNRLRIFALLTRGELCVCDIEASMQLSQNLVSHHLRVMREAGLLHARRDGRWMYYSINKRTLERIYPTMCALFNPDCVSDSTAAC